MFQDPGGFLPLSCLAHPISIPEAARVLELLTERESSRRERHTLRGSGLQPQDGSRQKWRHQRPDATLSSVLVALSNSYTLHILAHTPQAQTLHEHKCTPDPHTSGAHTPYAHIHTLQQGRGSGAMMIPLLVCPLWAVSTSRWDSVPTHWPTPNTIEH